MNPKIILFTLLFIGLSVVEWGCNPDDFEGGGGVYLVDITGIEEWYPVNFFYQEETKVSVSKDSLGYNLRLGYEHHQANISGWSSSRLFATPPAIPETNWRYDSIELINMNANTNEIINHQFVLVSEYNLWDSMLLTAKNANENIIRNAFDLGLYLKWNDTISMPIDLALKINIYGSDSTFFTATAHNIIVTP